MVPAPLLATLVPIGAAASPATEGLEPATPSVSTPPRRKELKVLADNEELNVPQLATSKQRREWVVHCLALEGSVVEGCDLRLVQPFNACWWAELPTGLPRRVSLIVGRDDPSRPQWDLKVRVGGEIWQQVLFDARSGLPGTRQFVTISTGAGRPFEGRLAACAADEGSASSAWVERALQEHASVASFARHLLELMSLGAPLELLAEVSRAQADEVRHTALALERASARGAHVTLGPLDIAVPTRRSAFDIALGLALEGCVNESLSAEAELRGLAEATGRDAEVLASIAADEAEHAALAWRTLDWLLPRLGRAERRRVRTAMYRALHGSGETGLVARVDALAA